MFGNAVLEYIVYCLQFWSFNLEMRIVLFIRLYVCLCLSLVTRHLENCAHK